MNTVNTSASRFSTFFASKEDYLAFKAHWKELANKKALSGTDAALRLIVLRQDAERVMPPTKNPIRLANGALYCSGLFRAMNDLSYEGRKARLALNKAKQGETPTYSAFAERWLKHGISLNTLALMEDRACTSHFEELR